MSTVYVMPSIAATHRTQSNPSLAASITRAASKQTYYTVRFLVDRERVADAYRAYGYFRWLDDRLDQGGASRRDRMAFVGRQQFIADRCYRGEWPGHLTAEEHLLADLIRSDDEPDSGLQSYIRNLMAVMAFDAGRRGRLISHAELNQYTRWLATAVTDALHHFIGHDCPPPPDPDRYQAAAGAHVVHMLRDTLEDVEAGYVNIPREIVEAHRIDPGDVDSQPYRAWVESRVHLARSCFEAGRAYLARVPNPRCRLAGYAYIARFDGLLDTIERDGYRLRATYPERKHPATGLRMGWSALALAFDPRRALNVRRAFSTEQ